MCKVMIPGGFAAQRVFLHFQVRNGVHRLNRNFINSSLCRVFCSQYYYRMIRHSYVYPCIKTYMSMLKLSGPTNPGVMQHFMFLFQIFYICWPLLVHSVARQRSWNVVEVALFVS